MSGDEVLTARLGAMKFAEDQAARAEAHGLDAYTAGWDDDRVSVSARDLAVLLDAYEAAARP
jgi:hypothetical protein